MIERNCKKACAGCPRGLEFEKAMSMLDMVREAQAKSAGELLDDDVAAEYAEKLFNMGFADDPEDLQSLRDSAASAIEFFQFLEEKLLEERAKETQFCVGALTMKAKSGSTAYEVTLCRTPMQTDPSPLQQTVVKRSNISN